MINQNKSEGLIRLLDIAKNDYKYGAEFSQDASHELVYYLFTKPGFWVDSFSKIKFDEIKAFIINSGLASEPMTKGYETYDRYSKKMINDLQSLKKNATNQQLIEYLISYLKNN